MATMSVLLQPRSRTPGSLFLLQETQFGPGEISAYNRQLVAICEAIKHFSHMLEAPHFFIFTDHKPITYTIQQKQDKYSQRQFYRLDFFA
jgi:hypothetical protein